MKTLERIFESACKSWKAEIFSQDNGKPYIARFFYQAGDYSEMTFARLYEAELLAADWVKPLSKVA